MAHFAKISEENEVLEVNHINDSDMQDTDGIENETVGQTFLEQTSNWPAHLWIQTSYNTHGNVHQLEGTPFRGNYAAIGYIWDSTNQIFWSEKPYPSWVKNITNAKWESPVGNAPELTAEQKSQNETDSTHDWIYSWNEENQTWDLSNTLA
tara:strand:- start:912 stop:1364 length:453 start_codon:yes stop_codon:yes gene_type:complete